MKLGRCLVLGAVAGVVIGCNNGGASQPAPSGSASALASAASAAPSAQAQPPKPMHRNHRGGGMFGLLLRATRDLKLSDAQTETLGNLDDQLHEGDATRGAELETLDADVAAGIRAGKIDGAKMQADYAAIDAAMQARVAKENTALNGLYAALDPAQRKQAADGIRAKQAERDERMKSMPDAGAPDFVKMRVTRMTSELGLDDAQQKQVAAVLAKGDGPAAQQARRDAAKQRLDALLAAFTGDGFDASKIPPPGKSPHEAMENDVTHTGQLLPILKPEQREKLAAQRERMAQMRAHMGSGDSPWGDDSIIEEGMRRGPGGGPGMR